MEPLDIIPVHQKPIIGMCNDGASTSTAVHSFVLAKHTGPRCNQVICALGTQLAPPVLQELSFAAAANIKIKYHPLLTPRTGEGHGHRRSWCCNHAHFRESGRSLSHNLHPRSNGVHSSSEGCHIRSNRLHTRGVIRQHYVPVEINNLNLNWLREYSSTCDCIVQSGYGNQSLSICHG